MAPKALPLHHRIARRVKIDERGCWRWQGAKSWCGYGLLRSGDTSRAHRVSYLAYKGEIPADFVVDHLCRIKDCVNPFHLEAVTTQENVSRGLGKHKDECVNGHAMTPENTYMRPDRKNARECRICRRAAARKAVSLGVR